MVSVKIMKRCFKCCMYEHIMNECKGTVACSNCEEPRGRNLCTKAIKKCINCSRNNKHYPQVKYRNEILDSLLIGYGVPQGTVLGMIDIAKHIRHCKIALFADDTKVYISSSNIKDLVWKINRDLTTIYEIFVKISYVLVSINVNICLPPIKIEIRTISII